MLKKVFYNTGAQIIGKGITASITLLVTIIISRAVGPAGFGEYTKIFVFVGYFYTLADFGLNTIYIKIAKENEVKDLRALFGLRILLGLILVASAVVISSLFPYNSATQTGFSPMVKLGIIIASVTILTHALFTTTNAFFQKILHYELSTLAAGLGYLVVLTTAVFVSLTSKSVLGYASAYTLGGLTMSLVAYLIISKRVKQFYAPIFSKEKFIAFLKPTWPVGIALLFNLIYFRIDVLILSHFRSSSEVGYYGLSYQFFEATLAIPLFFSNAIYPVLSKTYNENLNEFKKQTKMWLFILIGVSILLTLALIIVSFLIPLIFNKDFAPSIPSLQILSLGIPFFFVSALIWHLLIIKNKQKYLTLIYALGAIFNIAANLIFIPKSGYIAASIITVISEALIVLMLVLALRHSTPGVSKSVTGSNTPGVNS